MFHLQYTGSNTVGHGRHYCRRPAILRNRDRIHSSGFVGWGSGPNRARRMHVLRTSPQSACLGACCAVEQIFLGIRRIPSYGSGNPIFWPFQRLISGEFLQEDRNTYATPFCAQLFIVIASVLQKLASENSRILRACTVNFGLCYAFGLAQAAREYNEMFYTHRRSNRIVYAFRNATP